jgi:hypothetical protein
VIAIVWAAARINSPTRIFFIPGTGKRHGVTILEAVRGSDFDGVDTRARIFELQKRLILCRHDFKRINERKICWI